MTPLRKHVIGKAYPSTYHVWEGKVTPPAPFKRVYCLACGLLTRRTWGHKHCKCNPETFSEK